MAGFGTSMPYVKLQWFDNNGLVAAGYKLFTYASGTTTKQDTFTTAALSVANTNPIVLDSAGRASVFLSPTSYKFVMAPPADTDPPSSPIWTVDNVLPIPGFFAQLDVSGTAGENITAGQCVYLSDGTGGRTASRWYLADANTEAYSRAAPFIGFTVTTTATGISGTIRLGGRVADQAGLSAGTLYYISTTPGAITATAPTITRGVLVADSSTSGLIVTDWDPNVDVQTFIVSGTWTKPAGVRAVTVMLWGGGGSGGGGAAVAGGVIAQGGSGGGGGARVIGHFAAADLGATESVTVGSVAGGAGAASGGGNGAAGSIGTTSTFASWLRAYGGGGGAGGLAVAATISGGSGAGKVTAGTTGTTASSTGGAPGGAAPSALPTADGGGGSSATGGLSSAAAEGGGGAGSCDAAADTTEVHGAISIYGGGGGGSGGGVTAAGTRQDGSQGGATGSSGLSWGFGGGGGGTGGVVGAAFNANQNGATGTSVQGGTGGGGGGGRRDGTAAAAGGAGGAYGGGGAGGGAGQNGTGATAGGNGGAGGTGACVVISW